MVDTTIIVLDPVNRNLIDKGLASGVKDFAGGNCTVSLMLMAVGGLFAAGCIQWLSSMTYQAASGAGAKHMRELVAQMRAIGGGLGELVEDPSAAILEIDRTVTESLRSDDFPTTHFGVPLAGSLIPWIDRPMPDGQTREEWKGHVEANKILGVEQEIPIDGMCVRMGAMRSHSQALTVKLTRDIPIDEITAMLAEANQWVRIVPNEKERTLTELTPAAVSGTLDIPIGRIHKMRMGPDYLTAFTVGDQLLWGAAEPVRRMLKIVLEHLG